MLLHPLVRTIGLSGILVLLVLVTHEVVQPIERALFKLPPDAESLLYLPLGFWVIVAYFERWWSALYLAPGLAIALALYQHPDLSWHHCLQNLLVMACTAPLVFAALSWTAGRANEPIDEPYAWRVIVTGGAITAMIEAVFFALIIHGDFPDLATIEVAVEAIASRFFGLVALLVILAVGFWVGDQFSGAP